MRLDWRRINETCWRATIAGAVYELRMRPAHDARAGWWDVWRVDASPGWLNSFPTLFAAQDFIVAAIGRARNAI